MSVARSKFLSYVLRHEPAKFGLTLDAAGWISVDDLLAACAAHGNPMTRAELDHVVATNAKRRFAFSPDGLSIRASQGHSLPVDLGYEPATPPTILFHGTVADVLPFIRSDGLRPMARHAVHLSTDPSTASAVGGRRGKPIILTIRALDMHRAGHTFQLSANNVWLTDHVPPAFITFPPRLSNGRDRRAIAHDTVAACEAGCYRDRQTRLVDIAPQIDAAVSGTRVVDQPLTSIPTDRRTTIEVTDESTVAAILRLKRSHLGALNFASAKNPGGGFLNGAQAQEESLARASALYPCLLTCNDTFYAPNRASTSPLYLDLAIASPDVPFFRDDTGAWLPGPILCSIITCPAPNASALRQQQLPLDDLPAVLHRRAALILSAACSLHIRTLILGAWGAGVFGNDPAMVADTFHAHLTNDYRGAFDHVTFAILDSKGDTLSTFRKRFA